MTSPKKATWAETEAAAAALIAALMDGDTEGYVRIMRTWASDPATSTEFTLSVAIIAGAMLTGAVGGDKARAIELANTWVTDAVVRRARAVEVEAIAEAGHTPKAA